MNSMNDKSMNKIMIIIKIGSRYFISKVNNNLMPLSIYDHSLIKIQEKIYQIRKRFIIKIKSSFISIILTNLIKLKTRRIIKKIIIKNKQQSYKISRYQINPKQKMEKKNNFEGKCSLKLQNYHSQDMLELKLKIDNEDVSRLNNIQKLKNYQIVIDNSGSMHGTNMELTKQLCLELVSYLKKEQPNSKIALMTFNTEISYSPNLQFKPLEQIQTMINNICACSGTTFHITFDKLKQIVQELPVPNNDDFVIIYLTDGQVQGHSDAAYMKDSFNDLKFVMNKFVQNVEIHALGMGRDHDAIILDKIIQLKTQESTYQFIRESSEIEQAFQNIVDIIGENYMEVNLKRKDNSENIISLYKGAFNIKNSLRNCVVLQDELIKEIINNPQNNKNNSEKQEPLNENITLLQYYELNIRINHKYESTIPFTLKDKRVNKKDEKIIPQQNQYEELNQMYNYIDIELKQVLTRLKEYINNKRSSVDRVEIQKYNDEITILSNLYNTSISKIFKLQSKQRQKLNENNPSLSSRLKEAVEITQKLLQSIISTVEIAMLNQLAYPTIANRLFAKRLTKRKTASIQQFNSYEILKQEISQEFQQNENDIKKSLQDVSLDIGICFLSCYDIAEALFNQDCLCVTFSVTRSELAIVRPESLQIKAVQPSVISGKSFIDCVKYSVEVNLENTGEFKKTEGKIVQGMMREQINAAMPLYLHPLHWKIARLWLEPILGWVVTLDPLGYHHSQKRTIPFMLLNHSIKQVIELGVSDYGMKQANMIEQTCLQIMKEEEQDHQQLEIEQSKGLKMRDELIKQYDDFMKDELSRLSDKITNIDIFVARLYLGHTLGWITIENKDIQQLFRLLIEESLRRFMQNHFNLYPMHSLVDIINNTPYNINAMNQEYINKLFPTLAIIHYYRYLLEGNDREKSIKQSKELINTKDNLESVILGENNDQLKGLFIQNVIQGQEKVRRTSIGLKKYNNPYTQSDQIFQDTIEIREKEKNENISYINSMNVKAKHAPIQIKGDFTFTTPYISKKVEDHIYSLVYSDDSTEYSQIIEDVSKFKQDTHWFLWVLISNNASDLKNKLLAVKNKFGPFKKFTKYHHYILGKQNILDSDELTLLETP